MFCNKQMFRRSPKQPTNILKTKLFDDIPPFCLGVTRGGVFSTWHFCTTTQNTQIFRASKIGSISGSSSSCEKESKGGEGLAGGCKSPWQVLAPKEVLASPEWTMIPDFSMCFIDVKILKPLGGGNSNIYDFQHEPWGDDPI